MATRQSVALDRKKLLADPIMVTTIVVLVTFLTLFILYPLAVLLVDSVYGKETGLTMENPRLCGVKQFQNRHDARYVVFFYKADQFHGTHGDSSPEVFYN